MLFRYVVKFIKKYILAGWLGGKGALVTAYKKLTLTFHLQYFLSQTTQQTFPLAAGLPDGIFSNQKIPIWVNFGVSCNGRCWYIV
jgi:hypothetical protein